MTEQTSRLAIVIDSSGAEKQADSLAVALDKMTQSGDKAVTSMFKVTKATDEEKDALNKLRAVIDPVGAAIDTVGRRFTELKKYFDKGLIDEEEFRSLSKMLNDTTDELSGVAQAQREAEKASKLAVAQQEAQADAFQRMLDKIDPLAAALRNLEQQQSELNTAFKSGAINTSQYDAYSKKLQDTRREVTGEAQAEREAAKAHDEQVNALRRLEAQIDPVGEAFRRLNEQQRQLDTAKTSGMLSPLAYDRLNSKLAESRDALEKTQAQLGKTGQSAAQTANAMRMIPAQMTDIIVGLSTGQSPFMVLMQQGWQLKDMFGGIGPAIKGVGGYVLGLINPVTLAAAAVGVLGLAYYKGSQEQDEFYKSLTLGGNLVGKTSGQLADMAARVSVAANTTTGAAASTLNQLVSSGKVAGDSLERVTTAIVKICDATGIATEKLVSDFNDIAADPVAAITKLNDQYHFLTLATYNQIKALQDEGNQQDAARVATDAYANAMQQRANDIHQNLGLLENAWDSLGKTAKGAWDAMLNIGREQTLTDKLATLNESIAEAQKGQKDGGFWNSFSARFTLSSPGLVEVRCRRRNEQGSNNARDSMYWQALRGRLLTRPSSYPGVSLMAVTVETGGKLAAQSDRRVNVVATRAYETGTARTISGALLHVGNSLGLEMDVDTINALESAYWTPRGENFDFATGDSISALEMLQKIANAGKSRFLLSDGLATVNREGIKPWTGVITPHEMVEELQSGFTVPSDDDFDGVDVTYINGTTWAEETVKCRTPDNPTPVKIENYKLDGVLNQDHAYQIGMRRLMKYLQQRVTFQTTTELDALCYNTGDRIVLTDDIPGNNTISCLVEAMTTAGGVTTFTVTEPLDWSFENPRALIRYQDGSASGLMVASRVGDFQLSVPHLSEFDDPMKVDLSSATIEPIRLVFCGSTRHVYDAIVEEIAPQSDGTCQVTAKEYLESFYQYDDATYPGEVA
ncbi:host specificity factor TipJ family phage tail protein [Klebsiella variicola]|uniref:host specificity factor TipJ family phage tail protein n=1 Tax=Klebsiella variicola TaxID=244366 RepID=UPI00316CAD3B